MILAFEANLLNIVEDRLLLHCFYYIGETTMTIVPETLFPQPNFPTVSSKTDLHLKLPNVCSQGLPHLKFALALSLAYKILPIF
jgi:hypothetical protein